MHCWPKESKEHVLDGTTITRKIRKRHDHPRKRTPCNQCHHEATKISQNKAKRGDTLKEEIPQATKNVKPSPRSKDSEPPTPQKVRLLPGQRVVWHLRHKIPGPGKFKIRWAGPYLIEQVYDNGSVDVTTMQGEDLGLVNLNKLRPYHEPESTQAYALQILACHIHEAKIRAKHNHLHKKNATTQPQSTSFPHPNREAISLTVPTLYPNQKTLGAEDFKGYWAQPFTLGDNNPQPICDKETNSWEGNNAPINHLGDTLGNLKLSMIEIPEKEANTTHPTPLDWIGGRTDHPPQ
jgi:hypothetical protein